VEANICDVLDYQENAEKEVGVYLSFLA